MGRIFALALLRSAKKNNQALTAKVTERLANLPIRMSWKSHLGSGSGRKQV